MFTIKEETKTKLELLFFIIIIESSRLNIQVSHISASGFKLKSLETNLTLQLLCRRWKLSRSALGSANNFTGLHF